LAAHMRQTRSARPMSRVFMEICASYVGIAAESRMNTLFKVP